MALSTASKVWGIFKFPFRQSGNANNTAMSSFSVSHHHSLNQPHVEGSHLPNSGGNSVSSAAKSLLPTRRRLKLDPANKLYFPSTKIQLAGMCSIQWLDQVEKSKGKTSSSSDSTTSVDEGEDDRFSRVIRPERHGRNEEERRSEDERKKSEER